MLCKDEVFQNFSRGFLVTGMQADWGPPPVALVAQGAARGDHSMLGWAGGTGDIVSVLWPCQSPPSHRNGFGIAEWDSPPVALHAVPNHSSAL